jgi:hypothetical protein
MRAFSKNLFGSVMDSFNQCDAKKELRPRRWINGAVMNPDDYLALLANAWLHKWINLSQLVSLK